MDPNAAGRLDTRLEDKYTREEGWLYMTGTQALVRLPIQQRLLDQAAGLDTGGYISGYRGSPLGRYDMELWAADDVLKKHNIQFRAGLNEDLAATAIWGSQYVGSFPGNTVDGVFGIWYGKGPGVDRSGDVLRHANLAGTSSSGGALVVAGDDHGAKSSTVANFSDEILSAVGIPVLFPSNTQELLDFGLHGIAMSRHSGCWVALKVVTDVVEGGGSVRVGPSWPEIRLPPAPPLPGGLGIRRSDGPLLQEDRLYHHKLQAALAYARINRLNTLVVDPPHATVGIVAAGKAWQDTVQAIRSLGLSDDRCAELGIRLLKVGMTWPLDPDIVKTFARGLETLVVVEEKRPVLEDQIRAALYGTSNSPRLLGKLVDGRGFDESPGAKAFPNAGELSPDLIARVLSTALSSCLSHCELVVPVARDAMSAPPAPMRLPGFCSGCPHNRSTRVVEGSRALAGIGCHAMATLVDPARTTTMSHMGGEGVMWLGQQAFTTERHVFANLGDGTFAHSGFLAVRQAVAAGVPITYKLLYNGFVAMTGGQAVEAGLTPAQILHGLAAEGVGKMAVVTDEPARYDGVVLPPGVVVHHRSAMDAVQRQFREYPDVSVILYDQPCATERRRLRKRGTWADPPKRTFINAAVCEGCGDCGKASNCMSIEPLETDVGRKRRINQDSCNKDFSCVDGFCPSFVTVHGGSLRKRQGRSEARAVRAWNGALPEPAIVVPPRVFSLVIAGIGGTGVVTIGQTLAVAAHVEGLFSSNLDVTGLSQKYGAVMSHVRLAPSPAMLHATRIGAGEADTLIGCDLVVAAGSESLSRLDPGVTNAVVCTDLVPTNDFARNPDWTLDVQDLQRRLQATLGPRVKFMDGQRLARTLMGDAIASNMFMLGAAWQLGHVPLSRASIERAIELNGVAVAANIEAFAWGRRAAHDLEAVERLAAADAMATVQPIRIMPRADGALNVLLGHRSRQLVEHTGRALSDRYLGFVERVSKVEAALSLGNRLSRAVAESYFKLLAVKDEWEVARLYASPEFAAALDEEFEGDFTLRFHLGAWPFARRDPGTGKVLKAELGSWVMTAFRWMSRLRGLRGTWLDPFRNNEERRLDQALLAQFETDVGLLLAAVRGDRLDLAEKIARLPLKVRGYGHVKQAQAVAAGIERSKLFEAWNLATAGHPAATPVPEAP